MDSEAFGDFDGAHALRRERADRLDLPTHGGRSALVAAVGLGLGDPLALAFEHQRALELGNRAKHGEDQPAAGRAGVDPEREDAQRDALALG